jgi:hypothetical protein
MATAQRSPEAIAAHPWPNGRLSVEMVLDREPLLRLSARWIRCGREARPLINLLRGLPRHAEGAQPRFKIAHNRALYYLLVRAEPVIPGHREWFLLGD